MAHLGNQEDLTQFVLDLLPANTPPSIKLLVRFEFESQLKAVIDRQIDIAVNGDLQQAACEIK
jgi:hypothetical protein